MFTKKISFGLIIWAIPYLTAIPLLPLRQIDPAFFKTIMIVEGLFVGAIMTVLYFIPVKKDFLREGVILGVVWILVNWIMDYFALLPFTHSGVRRYFIEIGLEYIGMFAMTISIGYILSKKIKS